MQSGERIVWGTGCSESNTGAHVVEFNEEETEATCCLCALVLEGDDLEMAICALEEARGGVKFILGDDATPEQCEVFSCQLEQQWNDCTPLLNRIIQVVQETEDSEKKEVLSNLLRMIQKTRDQ